MDKPTPKPKPLIEVLKNFEDTAVMPCLITGPGKIDLPQGCDTLVIKAIDLKHSISPMAAIKPGKHQILQKAVIIENVPGIPELRLRYCDGLNFIQTTLPYDEQSSILTRDHSIMVSLPLIGGVIAGLTSREPTLFIEETRLAIQDGDLCVYIPFMNLDKQVITEKLIEIEGQLKETMKPNAEAAPSTPLMETVPPWPVPLVEDTFGHLHKIASRELRELSYIFMEDDYAYASDGNILVRVFLEMPWPGQLALSRKDVRVISALQLTSRERWKVSTHGPYTAVSYPKGFYTFVSDTLTLARDFKYAARFQPRDTTILNTADLLIALRSLARIEQPKTRATITIAMDAHTIDFRVKDRRGNVSSYSKKVDTPIDPVELEYSLEALLSILRLTTSLTEESIEVGVSGTRLYLNAGPVSAVVL